MTPKKKRKFNWLNNIWFGSETVEFQSAYGLAESVERLRSVTRRLSIFSVFGQQTAAGSVKESRVSLRRVIPLVGNSFKPLFKGHFEQRKGTVVLIGQFRMSWFVRLFMGIWFAGIIAITASSILEPARCSRGTPILLVSAAMLVAATGLVSLGAWFSRNDPAWLSNVIRHALAKPQTVAPASVTSPVQISNNRIPWTIRIISGLLAVMGVTSIVLAVNGIQSYYAGPQGAVVTHFTDPALQRFTILMGGLMLGLSYGVYRRYWLAWRAGFVFLLFGQANFLLDMLTNPEFSHAGGEKFVGLAASLIVTLIWWRWWYAQRVHFRK